MHRAYSSLAATIVIALSVLQCEQPVAVQDRIVQLVWTAPPPDTLREGAAATVGVEARDQNGARLTDFDGVPLDLRLRFERDSQPGTACGAACTTTVAQGRAQVTVNWVSAGRWTARACARPPAADSVCVERGLVVVAVHAVLVAFPDTVRPGVRFPLEARLRLFGGTPVTDVAPMVRVRFGGVASVRCPESGGQCERGSAAGVARLDSVTVPDPGLLTVIACAIPPNGHERCDPAGVHIIHVVAPAPTLDHLAFSARPPDIVAGEQLPVVVELRDAQDQRLAGATDSIFVSAFPTNGSIGGADLLQGTKVVAAVDGRATFDDLSATQAGTLVFGARNQRITGPSTKQVSDTFVVAPDAATAGMVATSALTMHGPVSTPVPEVPTVRIRDTYGNGVSGITVTFSFTAGTGFITDSVRVTDETGTARLGGWILGAFTGTSTVRAAAPGFDPIDFTATAEANTFDVVSIAAGYDFTCAATMTTHLPYCWGENSWGQLGDGTPNGRNRPTLLAGGLLNIVEVSAGLRFGCALTAAGEAYCWGVNDAGQLGRGNGNLDSSWTPVRVSGGHTFQHIAAGGLFACGIDMDGLAWCWGDIGLPSDVTTPRMVFGFHEFTQIAAGAWHACGLTAGGEAWCWGRNDWGQLGDSTTTPSNNTPVRVVGGRTFTELAAGVQHTCGIAAGAVYCWGYDGGALGNGGRTLTAKPAPAPALGALGISQHLAAGPTHTCAINSAGETYCWGANSHGQLGDGTTTERLSGVLVVNAPPFVSISASQDHTCARRQNGNSYCWGWNAYGRLGLGSFVAADVKSPAPVVIP